MAVDGQDPPERAKAAGASGLARYDQILAAGVAANPPAGPPGQAHPAACLLDRLERHRDQVTRFVADFGVPFDNTGRA